MYKIVDFQHEYWICHTSSDLDDLFGAAGDKPAETREFWIRRGCSANFGFWSGCGGSMVFVVPDILDYYDRPDFTLGFPVYIHLYALIKYL